MDKLNVLSLFDGISCGHVALNNCGIEVNKYYASEIDKYAISITQYNFPGTFQLGDVNNWKDWDIDWNSIDILIGGSPCQSFSHAGRKEGFNGESGLFYRYLEILNYLKSINPNILFLLENVVMREEWRNEISNQLGVEPVMINANNFSAQSRNRLYWCNWKVDINKITEYNQLLKDIFENDVDEKYIINKEHDEIKEDKQPICRILEGNYDMAKRVMNPNLKSYTLMANGTRQTLIDNKIRKLTPVEYERLQTLPDNYTKYGLVLKDIVEPVEDKQKYNITDKMFAKKEGTLAYKKAWSSVRTLDEKSKTLTTSQSVANSGATNVKYNDNEYYKLTPIESERLQTLPDNYTKYGLENAEIKEISDAQRYKTVGNGWCVKVIEFLFNELIENNK